MRILNFTQFLETEEAKQGDPFVSLTTVIGMSPKDALKALEVPQYVADKSAGIRQIAATVADLKPQLNRGKLVGSKLKINPSVTAKTGSVPVYIRSSLNKNNNNIISGYIKPDDTNDLATLGFPKTSTGGISGI